MSQEQNPTSQPDEATGELGSLDAAALAFEKREQAQSEDEADTEAEADTETQDDDPNAEGDEADSDEDTDETDGLVEAEYEGKTYKVPPELQKALLRQADYSRNMNEVKAQERVYTQRLEQAEALIEGAESHAKALAEVQMLDARLKTYEAVNWQQLRAENPGEYAAHATDFQTLRLNRQDAERRAQTVAQEVEARRTQSFSAKRAEMVDALGKTLKGWGNEMGEKVTAYATQVGVKLETLSTLTDPGIVVALEKARKYDELQASKTALKAKTKDAPPVLKPGTRQTKQAPADEAMSQLRKIKTQGAAEAAFLARMR